MDKEMFCWQCQETLNNHGCVFRAGICGKPAETANRMDRLIYALKGLAAVVDAADARIDSELGDFICRALFLTITNANFDDARIYNAAVRALAERDRLRNELADALPVDLPFCAVSPPDPEFQNDAGVLKTADPDIRSLRELLTYGMKGLAAYTHHAAVLGRHDPAIYAFLIKGLAGTVKPLPVDELLQLVVECGHVAARSMELLDGANTGTYGDPVVTRVETGAGERPGILVSGHDLHDLHELLKQTEGKGVDVYTHCEMLPANAYPKLKAFKHLHGNYGGSWWRQKTEFESFRGPILMTTNCVIPVAESYRGRLFTTGCAGYPGCKHIPEPRPGEAKDFSELIALAQVSEPPVEIGSGKIVCGFAHHQALEFADRIVAAVKAGKIRRFVVMAGCDGRQNRREYYTELARRLPADTVILTAGCAKFRYNRLDLGDIDGIPRILDAGQCNDSYSLVVIAQKLRAAFGAKDVNDLPIAFALAWYEQKAVAVLLALVALGFRNIRLGPTLPAFVSPDVLHVMVEKFGVKATTTVEADLAAIMA